MNPMSELPPVKKPDWKKIVSESGGTRIFLPDELKKEADAIEEDRIKLKKESSKVAKLDLEFGMRLQNLFLSVRQHLAKNGMDDNWSKDIGYEADALKENVFIININEPQQRQ